MPAVFDANESKYKLVAYLKSEHGIFANSYTQDKKPKFVAYSPLKYDQNRKFPEAGLERLIKYFVYQFLENKCTCFLIYDNKTKKLIRKFNHKGEEENI